MPEHGFRKNGVAQKPPCHVSKAPKPRGRARRHYWPSEVTSTSFVTISGLAPKALERRVSLHRVLRETRFSGAFGAKPVSLDAFGARMVASLWAHDFLTFWKSLFAKLLA